MGIFFFCLELHDLKPFKPKNFWGRTPLPDTSTISKLPCHPCVCVERLAIVQRTIPSRQYASALSKLYHNDVPVGLVPHIFMLCVALFAVAEGWLLLEIVYFVLFLFFKTRNAVCNFLQIAMNFLKCITICMVTTICNCVSF